MALDIGSSKISADSPMLRGSSDHFFPESLSDGLNNELGKKVWMEGWRNFIINVVEEMLLLGEIRVPVLTLDDSSN